MFDIRIKGEFEEGCDVLRDVTLRRLCHGPLRRPPLPIPDPAAAASSSSSPPFKCKVCSQWHREVREPPSPRTRCPSAGGSVGPPHREDWRTGALAELALALMLPPLALVVASIDTHFLRRFHQYNLGGSVVMVTVPRAADPRSTARGSPGGRRPAVTSPHSSSSLINALPCPVL